LQLDYTHVLSHPRELVWNAMLDPDVMSRMIPGIEKFEQTAPDQYSVVAMLGVATVKGTYTGKVQISDRNEPSSYRIRGEGRGAPGWVKGDVLMTLTAVDAGTTKVAAKAKADIGGTIAGVGQRMMEGVGKAMAREFFESLDRELQGKKQKVSAFRFSVRVFFVMVRNAVKRIFRGRAAGEVT
jgi:carbon monoxide dehydrogenase subunit G